MLLNFLLPRSGNFNIILKSDSVLSLKKTIFFLTIWYSKTSLLLLLQGMDPNESLYQASLLTKLNFARSPAKFNPPITAVNPGETWMVVRPLQRGDYDKGFLQLLGQLTSVGNCTRKQFDGNFKHGWIILAMNTEYIM